MKIQDYFDKIDQLQADRQKLWDEWAAVRERWRDVAFAPDRVRDSATQARLDDLDEQSVAIERKRDAISASIQLEFEAITRELEKRQEQAAIEQKRFRRPTGPWSGLINRLLGPLPADTERIGYDATEFAKVPGRWFLAVMMFLAVLLTAMGLGTALPYAGSSPVSLAAGEDLTTPIICGVITVFLGLLAVLHVTRKMSIKEAIYTFALIEEQWFRQGAEAWTRRRRVGSSVGFGVAHLGNLIVAFSTAGMLVGVGAVLMAVYMFEMRATGDQRRAVIACAKVHAHYNFVTLGLITVVVAAYWTSVLSSLLM